MTAPMQIQDRSISSGGYRKLDRYNKLAGAANAAAGAASLRANSASNYYSMAVLSWKYSTRDSAADNDDDDDAQDQQDDINTSADDDNDDDELLEEDVWGSVPSLVMVKENHIMTDQNTKDTNNHHAGNTIGFMMTSMRQASGDEDQDEDQPFASKPIGVPARPKLKKLTTSSCYYDYDDDEGDNDDDDGGGGSMKPPHLIAARAFAKKEVGLWSSCSFASSTSSSASVVEGAGRTLKGRDQRNLRDAVWRSTGFLD